MITFRKIILCLFMLTGHLICSQIITDPDRHIKPDPRKAILMISSLQSGSLFINGHFLTRLQDNDTIYLNDLDTGSYRIQLRFDQENVEPQSLSIQLTSGSVMHLMAGRDLVSIVPGSPERDEMIGFMTGRKHYSIKNGQFYSIVQLSLFGFEMDSREVLWFHSFGTIFGYQVRPGFCAGLGVSLNYFSSDLYADAWYDISDEIKLWFLPVYLDFRFHLPPSANGAIYPFFKLDMGANLPLNKETGFYNGYETIRIERGGLYFSPGFGIRIFPGDLIQIVAGFEYSLEISRYVDSHYWEDKAFLNLLKFNIGAVVQF